MTLFLEQMLNGVQFGVMLFLLAAGLTLVFGIMGVINLAHGSLYMIGAYAGTWIAGETGSFLLGILGALAAAALAGRRKIFIFARGNAETLGVLLNRRLRRMAFDTVLLTGDSRDLAEQILSIGPDDAFLAFAFRRQPRHYAPLIERARKVGAVSVVIAGSIGPSLIPAADHLLSAPRSRTSDAFQTLTVPMAICNALVLSIAQSDERRSLRQLELLGELIGEFEKP